MEKILNAFRAVPGRLAAVPDRVFSGCLLAASAVGAFLLHPRYYVGYFNDDASFVLIARAVWGQLPGQGGASLSGAFAHFLPGYPVFLAPFTALFGPEWALLRWTTAGLTLLTVWGLWRLLGGWFSAGARRWALLLYVLHPVPLLCSGVVMADPLLACLFVWGLLWLRLVLEGGGGAWPYALLLGACAWSAATKPIGLLLPAAVTAALALARARRGLLLLGGLFWLPLLALGLAFFLRKQNPTDYLTQLSHGLAALSALPLWDRGYGLLHTFVLVCGLGWFWPRGPLWDAGGAALAAAVLWVCALGLRELLRQDGRARFAAAAAGLLLAGQFLVMSLWTVYSERYALPMLPLALPLFVAGALSLRGAAPYGPRLALAALAAGFALHSAGLALQTRSSAAPPESRLCGRTLEWIRRETPPASRFAGNAPLIYLYTGRSGDGLFAAPDLDAYLARLAASGITHVLLTGQPVLSPKGTYSNDHGLQKRLERDWVRSHPAYFKKLFSEASEGTEIYGVVLPAGHAAATRAYARALESLRASDLEGAEKNLRLALAENPDFPSALLALAFVRANRAKDLAGSEKLLRRALELEPGFARAAQALSGLLARQGRTGDAELVRARAAAGSFPPFEAGAAGR